MGTRDKGFEPPFRLRISPASFKAKLATRVSLHSLTWFVLFTSPESLTMPTIMTPKIAIVYYSMYGHIKQLVCLRALIELDSPAEPMVLAQAG